MRLIAYLCRMKAKWTGDEIGEVSLRSSTDNPDPIFLPTRPPSPHLIAWTVMSHPLTPHRAATAAPEKTASKDAPADGREIPPADSFRAKEPGTEPATVQRFEGWAIYGLDSHLRMTESGTTMGEPVHGRGPGKRLLGMPQVVSETSRSSLKGIPP